MVNKDKAETFKQALGYTTQNVQKLFDNIYQHLNDFDAVNCEENKFGEKYKVEMYLKGENGKTARVMTIWMKYHNSEELEMVNAYIKNGEKRMKYKQYDKVKLKDGTVGVLIEVFSNGEYMFEFPIYSDDDFIDDNGLRYCDYDDKIISEDEIDFFIERAGK